MRRSRIVWGVISLVAVVVIAGLVFRPATVIGSDESSLAYSLRGSAGADKTGACKGGNDMFTCTAFGKGKGRARYKVSVDSYGCWDARRKGGGKRSGGLPRTLSGCITITDLLRLSD